MRILAAALAALLGGAAATFAQSETKTTEAAWNVDEDRAPYTVFELDAREGTWISVDVSPDGKHIVFDLLGHLYEMPFAGGTAQPLTEGRSWNMFPRYSPDGSRIAFTSDRGGGNNLWVLERANQELKNVSRMELPVFQGSWSRDGRHLYGTALDMKVEFPAYQFNFHGKRQALLPAGGRTPVNHFIEHAGQGKLYYVHHDQQLPASGPRIKTYDLKTGKSEVYIERPGGAASPALSPDGRTLVYVHRDDKQTELIAHDLATRAERVLLRGLDTGRFEWQGFYGAYSNLSWHPAGREVVLSYGGKIRAVNASTGAARQIEFRAPVRRKVDDTLRVKQELPEQRARTRSHRWGVPLQGGGAIFEALGDLYSARGEERVNLTRSAAHETNPIAHEASGRLYYASWTDAELGAIYTSSLAGGRPRRLTATPSQYGSLALSRDGRQLAFVRGGPALAGGTQLEDQTDFELAYLDDEGRERRVTDLRWVANRYAKRPPSVLWSADGARLLFTEYEEDTLVLKRIRLDGLDEETLYKFPHATRAVVSPDLQWIAFREYHRDYVTPFEFIGQVLEVSAADGKGFTVRVDPVDGDFMEWTQDGSALYWTRGTRLYRKPLVDVLAGRELGEGLDLSFEYEIERPDSLIALTGVQVVTMNASSQVLPRATVLVRGNRIQAIGVDLPIPPGAQVYDLAGRTVIPGMFDAHGHYGSPVSALNVIEQRLYGLHANLAYGVTTMFDVYGTTQKDFWVSDMLQKGAIDGPRIFSVGDPIFVTKYRTKMHRSIQSLQDAREHVRFNQEHGAVAVKDYSNHNRAARQQLAAAARELGVNLVTESFGDPAMNLTQVIDGFTGIEHTMGVTPLYDDVRKLLAHTRIGMTPTLIVAYNGAPGERYFHMRERLWEDEKLAHFFRKEELLRLRRPTHYFDDDFNHMEVAREMKRLYQAGVPLQLGAHGQMMGLGAHWELEMLVSGGFTPHEALQIATINGYRHHGLEHELGSLEKGKLADLVVLEKNPLTDIRNSRSIEYVMKNGVLYSGRDASRVYPGPRPAQPLYFLGRGPAGAGSAAEVDEEP